MTLDAVILDVDGTLAATEEAHRCAFNQAFADRGLAWSWDAALYRELLAVTGGRERIHHYALRHRPPGWEQVAGGDGAFLAELQAYKTRLYGERVAAGQVAPRPGVRRLIGELRACGVRLAIATTTSRVNVEALLRHSLDLPLDAFEVIGAGEDAPHKKPDPAVYRWVLGRLGLPAGRCIAIEDSDNGVQAARRADLPVLVTENEWTAGEGFAGACAVLSDLGEPAAPFRIIRGEARGRGWVDAALLRYWHGPRP